MHGAAYQRVRESLSRRKSPTIRKAAPVVKRQAAPVTSEALAGFVIERGQANVSELVARFEGASVRTIRRRAQAAVKAGRIVTVHAGSKRGQGGYRAA